VTDLPATLVEAEALTYAREWIARMRPGELFPGLGTGALDPEAAHLTTKRLFRTVTEAGVLGLSWVSDMAIIHGERAAHEVLVDLKREHLERNEPLGSVLGNYFIREERAPFHPGPGRTMFIQDIGFCLLMIELAEKFGLDPTKHRLVGKKVRLPRGCDIASRAAAEAGLHRGTPDAFRKMWKKFGPGILNGFRVRTPEALALLMPHGACRV
jgi:hypothetical protein